MPAYACENENCFKHNDVSSFELQEIKDLIREQLAAIRARDASRAYATLSDHLHEKFEGDKKYLAKLRFDYSPIYNHRSYTFLETRALDDGGFIQRVSMKDRYSGKNALVIYKIKEDQEGHLLIDSFTIIDMRSKSI
jgi:hypothetical protein